MGMGEEVVIRLISASSPSVRPVPLAPCLCDASLCTVPRLLIDPQAMALTLDALSKTRVVPSSLKELRLRRFDTSYVLQDKGEASPHDCEMIRMSHERPALLSLPLNNVQPYQ
jgi:hypothetical protein